MTRLRLQNYTSTKNFDAPYSFKSRFKVALKLANFAVSFILKVTRLILKKLFHGQLWNIFIQGATFLGVKINQITGIKEKSKTRVKLH